MTLHLRTTPYGRPALAALADAVREAKSGEPLAPVTVVVPSNHIGVTVRRLLARGTAGEITPRGKGTIGVTFLTAYRLAELLGSAHLAGNGRRPVTTAVIAAAVRRALRSDPGVFGPVAEHPATEQALVAAYQELTDLSTKSLDRLGAASSRAADTVRLYRAARASLAASWYDEHDLISAALGHLERSTDAPLETAGQAPASLIVYLPQDLTRRSAHLLGALAQHTETTVIAGLTGDSTADRGVYRSLERLGATEEAAGPGPATSSSPSLPLSVPWPVSAEGTHIVTTSDPEEEVRVAVDVALGAAREGVPLERLAVLYPTREPYARLLHEHLAAAGVPTNGPAVRSLAESTYGRTLLQLLRLPSRSYRRSDVLGLLTSAPLRRPAGTTTSTPSTADWERISREAGVVAGRPHWDQRLTGLAERLDRGAEEIEASQTSHEHEQRRADQQRRRASRVRDLQQLVLELIDTIDEAGRAPRGWAEHVRWLRRTDGRLHGGEAGRSDWPEGERNAAGRVDAALDRLAALDDFDEPCSLEAFARTLEAELDADLGRTGRFGEGILVAPLTFGVGLDLDLVVVVGLAEGSLPTQLNEDSLLPDHERRQTRGELALRRDYAALQQRQLRAALTGAPRHVLTSPRGDLRASSHRSPSRWLAEMTTDDTHALRPNREEQPSFAHRIGRNSFPATEQEYRLRAGPDNAPDAVLAAGAKLVDGRRSAAFTRYDGNLAGLDLPSPTEQIVSATRLETWADCPHSYFMRHLLRVEPVEDPEDQLQISALVKGSLIHEILERFVRAVLPQGPATWNDEHRSLLRKVAVDVCDAYEARSVVGRPLFWRRDRARILARLDRFLDEDHHRRHNLAPGSPYRSVAAELAFGMPGSELGPTEVSLPDGRTLHFRGSADRVDRTDRGELLVIDYKTGGSASYKVLSEKNPDDRGRRLQLLVYGLAARAHDDAAEAPVRAEYWFVNDRESLTPIGYEISGEVVAAVSETLTTITDGIAAGIFPAHPTESATDPWVRCRFCNPDGLGVGDLKRAWERKRSDPALAGYVRLAEPDDDATSDDGATSDRGASKEAA